MMKGSMEGQRIRIGLCGRWAGSLVPDTGPRLVNSCEPMTRAIPQMAPAGGRWIHNSSSPGDSNEATSIIFVRDLILCWESISTHQLERT
jgi:hypothetical protein